MCSPDEFYSLDKYADELKDLTDEQLQEHLNWHRKAIEVTEKLIAEKKDYLQQSLNQNPLYGDPYY